uniref:Uncharacterized protein n=1 Tax=Panagrolaimus sp. JU765 TaxID=591449 RepID=A0AC34Q7J9_9BILA
MTGEKETSKPTIEKPEGVPKHGSSEWAKDKDEEDKVEKMIKDSGCWVHHLATVECMSEKKDWRQCQNEVQSFKDCMFQSRSKFMKEVEKKK